MVDCGHTAHPPGGPVAYSTATSRRAYGASGARTQDADAAKGRLAAAPESGGVPASVRSHAVLIGVVVLLSVATLVAHRALRAGIALRDGPVAECASRFDADKAIAGAW